MKAWLTVLSALILAGCADSGPMKVGPDTYTISTRVPFGGPASAKGQALKEANTFCRDVLRSCCRRGRPCRSCDPLCTSQA